MNQSWIYARSSTKPSFDDSELISNSQLVVNDHVRRVHQFAVAEQTYGSCAIPE